ncbi:unnamed protein product [Fraxinus pennsylvanica]|uniref:PPM-type phosphatase domain-containing protein n=1 Tax=Fraxinus pennsylvanica TaxID=56036 RepID=A0AAD1ZGN8_9LAMI|nr:unnamed protein product [Fraxinus pennsylvanica]
MQPSNVVPGSSTAIAGGSDDCVLLPATTTGYANTTSTASPNEVSAYAKHFVGEWVPCSVSSNFTPHIITANVGEKVRRIRTDPLAVFNGRVKGSLKVTRAFGTAFLKQPKWNNALLEMFRIDYVGNSPYIPRSPSRCHHRLESMDKFLILSSDGLYQYFTNENAVSEVEWFMTTFPEGDPAQHLVEEFSTSWKYTIKLIRILQFFEKKFILMKSSKQTSCVGITEVCHSVNPGHPMMLLIDWICSSFNDFDAIFEY